jgi:hypothetical protein
VWIPEKSGESEGLVFHFGNVRCSLNLLLLVQTSMKIGSRTARRRERGGIALGLTFTHPPAKEAGRAGQPAIAAELKVSNATVYRVLSSQNPAGNISATAL